MYAVILALLTATCHGLLTNIVPIGYDLNPDFDIDNVNYTVLVPLEETFITWQFNNTDDRLWVQIYRDWPEQFTYPYITAETATYDLLTLSPVTTVGFDLEEGTNWFHFKEEFQQEYLYHVEVIRAVITTTTTTALETTTTTVATTTTTGPPTSSTTNEPGDGNVALPEQSPDVSECDEPFASEILVQLIAFAETAQNNTDECADFTVMVERNDALVPDDMCPCFLSTNNKEYLYGLSCRPNNATLYTYADSAYYCFGDEAVLEGPTNTSLYFNKSEDEFDTSTWSGTDDDFIYPGQKMRQTYIGNDMDSITGETTEYMLIQFDACAYGDWEEGDAIIVEIGYTQVYEYQYPGGSYGTDGECSEHSLILPLDPYFDDGNLDDDEHEFTIGFTSNLAGDDEYFDATPTYYQTMTRKDVSNYCVEIGSYNASVNHPIFVQETSGFIHNYAGSGVDSRGETNSLRLHLEAEVPRHLYDFTIDFENGDGYAGYSLGREFVDFVTDKTTETYWTSDLLTDDTAILSTQDNCGYETWTADIPWDVFNEGLAGGTVQIEQYNNGSGAENVTDEYYVYGSTSVFTGSEVIDASGGGRQWLTDRYNEWRVPFMIRWQREVEVETETNITLCPEGDVPRLDLCTLNSVVAIVEQVQANTVYDLSTQAYRADVNLKINTLVLYPYIFVTGENDDDPPMYWESYNQTDIYPAPLDSNQWFPPTVTYTPTGPAPSDTQVLAEITFTSEERDECTFINDNNIAINLERECPQYWNMYIQPLNGACFIDGDYTVTWTARCFYDKPVCSFNDDANGNTLNTVEVVFSIHSTNMCPEVVHEVDIYGEICATGRVDYYFCAEAEAQMDPVDINTYFQNEEAHFFMEVGSDSARIIYTEILEIWTDQNFVTGEWPVDDSLTAVDYDYNGLVKLWDNTTGDASYTFSNSLTGADETVPNVVVEVLDSNDFVSYPGFETYDHGLGDVDMGTLAGYTVFLDSRVFPRDSDRWLDAEFRVKLYVLYEGWGDVKPDDRRRLVEEGEEPIQGEFSMGGSKTLWLTETIRIAPRKPVFVPCYEDKADAFWTLTIDLTDEQLRHYRSSLEQLMTSEMQELIGKENVDLLGYTFDAQNPNQLVAVFDVHENSKWSKAEHTFSTGEFENSALFFKEATTTAFYCMDAPQETSVTALTECAKGMPCEFLPENVRLEDYYGQGVEPVNVEESSSSFALATFATLVIALLF